MVVILKKRMSMDLDAEIKIHQQKIAGALLKIDIEVCLSCAK